MINLIKIAVFFLIQISFLYAQTPELKLEKVERKLGIANFNNAIKYNDKVIFMGNSATLVSYNSESDNSNVEYGDYNANFDIHCGVVFSENLYTFGSNGNVWIFDPDYTPEKLTIADTARIVNAQIIGKKLYLLNTIGKLYSSNFDNFELNLIDSNVSDIFTYFDEILYLKENKLISISSNEVMKELTQFEKPVSRLKIKSNYIVAYSDSSYMYKYDYDKNFIEDLSIKSTAYIQTLGIADDGRVVGISVENQYIVEGFIRDEMNNEWQYNRSNNNIIEKVFIFNNEIFGLITNSIKRILLSEITNNEVDFGRNYIYQGLDYRTKSIVNFKNKPYSLLDFNEYYLITMFGSYENVESHIRSDYSDLGYRINIHSMYSDNENIYLFTDTNYVKEKKRVYSLERVDNDGSRKNIFSVDTLSALLLPNIVINEDYLILAKDNSIYWSTDQGNNWESEEIENAEYIVLLEINKSVIYYEYLIDSDIYQFGMFDLENSTNVLLSKKPSFIDLTFLDNGTIVGLVNPINSNPNNDITDKILYYSKDGGVNWDTTFIFSNLLLKPNLVNFKGSIFCFFINRVIIFSQDLDTFKDLDLYYENTLIDKHFGSVRDLYFGNFIVIKDSVYSSSNGENLSLKGNIEMSLTNVSNIEKSTSISYYPQPASNNLNIDLDDSWTINNISVSIFSADGKTISKGNDISLNGNGITWDCSKQIRGIYFIEIRNNEKSEIIKVAVE